MTDKATTSIEIEYLDMLGNKKVIRHNGKQLGKVTQVKDALRLYVGGKLKQTSRSDQAKELLLEQVEAVEFWERLGLIETAVNEPTSTTQSSESKSSKVVVRTYHDSEDKKGTNGVFLDSRQLGYITPVGKGKRPTGYELKGMDGSTLAEAKKAYDIGQLARNHQWGEVAA